MSDVLNDFGRAEEIRHLCIELPQLMERCHRVGLHETGHAMHAAVQVVGYEAERALWPTEDLARQQARAEQQILESKDS